MKKDTLRQSLLKRRHTLPGKAEKSNLIIETVQSLPEYQAAKTLICYVSLADEVATDGLIAAALQADKIVAVPCCSDSEGNMDFYQIRCLSDLHVGTFGVREPDTSTCVKITDFSDSLCLVPGLAFTTDGARLGYGKGYYDKFLQNYAFLSVGLCYNDFILEAIPTEQHDIPVDMVVTEKQFFGGNYGRI